MTDEEEEDSSDFNILEDIDTVMFFRVNSFVHSLTGYELEHPDFLKNKNDTIRLASDKRSEYASSKINDYFHGLMTLLSAE